VATLWQAAAVLERPRASNGGLEAAWTQLVGGDGWSEAVVATQVRIALASEADEARSELGKNGANVWAT
jgi:hypothetical protein